MAAPQDPPESFNAPIVTNRPARARSSSRLRIVLLNAAGGAQLSVIEACLKRSPLDNADVILLCEADRGIMRSGGRDVSSDLAASLAMSCVYVPEYKVGREGRALLGNAILSAAPFEEVEAVAMPSASTPVMSRQMKRYKYAGMPTGILATAKFDGEILTMGLAHLHSRCAPPERERQLAAYMAAFPAAGRAIFGGDLNTTTTDLLSASSAARLAVAMLLNSQRFRAPESYEPLFDRIRERGLRIDGANELNRGTFTFSGIIPRLFRPKLDWIALRDLSPLPGTARVVSPRLSILSRRASDHDFVAVDVEY